MADANSEVRTRGLWLLLLIVVIALFGLGRLVLGSDNDAFAPEARPDLVVIEPVVGAEVAEKPPVSFKHQLHVDALRREGAGPVCGTCHETRPDSLLSFSLSGIDGALVEDLRDAFHDRCLGCHAERDAGPTPEQCGDCHQREPAVVLSHDALRMDRMLHARHVAAAEDKCELCHRHVPKGQESSVYDRLPAFADGEEPPLAETAHLVCVSCHLGQEPGKSPTDCAACHDASVRQDWTQLEEIPRLVRNQPDRVYVRAAEADTTARMATVAFDHRLHEEQTDDCRSCHHQTMKACRDCHTIGGIDEGAGVNLATAMHDDVSMHSCVGCHEQRKAESDCAGCHIQLPDEVMDERFCAKCHDGPPPAEVGETTPSERVRRPAATGFDLASVPEMVDIDYISDEYEQAIFPHRAIMAKLLEIADASPLATVFHDGSGQLCRGCHHHSPVSATPPKCGSCHGAAFRAETMHQPGLNGAYHRQCIGCHEQMGLKAGCTDCHAERTAGPTTATPQP